MTQKVIFKIPEPEIGYNKARVTVLNNCGESIQDIYYVYPNVCIPIPGLNPETIAQGNSGDATDAADACLEDIIDLYCDPTSTTQDGIPITSNATITNFGTRTESPYASGQQIQLFYLIQGTGFYRISRSISNNTNAETLAEFEIQNNVEETYTTDIPDGLSQGDTIVYKIEIIGNNSGQDFKVITLTITYSSSVSSEIIQLSLDNDISDAKKEIYTISHVLSKNLEDLQERVTNDYYFEKDLLRDRLQSFYIKNNGVLVFAGRESELPEIISSNLSIITYNSGQPLNICGFKETINDINFLSLVSTTQYEDITYVYQKPYTLKEAQGIDLPYNSLILNIKNEYNYYNKKYEAVHYNIKESLLPNFYLIQLNNAAANSLSEENTGEYDFTIQANCKTLMSLKQEDTQYPSGISKYYKYYVEKSNNIQIDQDKINAGIFDNIFLPYSFYENMESYNSAKSRYPFYCNVSFDSSEEVLTSKTNNTSIAEILKQDKYFATNFITVCANEFRQKTNKIKVQNNLVKQEYDIGTTNLFSSPNRFIEIDDPILSAEMQENFLYFGNYNELQEQIETANLQSSYESFKESLVKNVVAKKFRSYLDILKGKKCYSETIYYRIAKYRSLDLIGKDETGIKSLKPLQNIIIPRDPDRKTINYIDTQVKYEEKYTYIIYSYDMVLYNKIKKEANSDNTYIKNSLGVMLIENFYDSFDSIVVDKPPCFPEIDFTTYRNIDNKILIRMKNNYVNYQTNPIVIKNEEQNLFSIVRQSQGLETTEKISFAGDDIIKKFQIFKTTIPPRNYMDFSKASMIEVSTALEQNSDIYLDSGVFFDAIEPNIKYYYTFRCIDIHDQISNPTEVYEVEMINESGTIYPIIKTREFPKNNLKQETKNVKRLLMIQPQLSQKIINLATGNSNTIEQLKNSIVENVGSTDDKIWNKKYKLRIVSKKTNKVYDIKFKFDKKGEIIE